jgi:hypothetical protein
MDSKLIPAALPHTDDATQVSDPFSAYNLCLDFERNGAKAENDIMHARVLGYLILHAASQALDARHEVAKEI